jgi:hypothetical protein
LLPLPALSDAARSTSALLSAEGPGPDVFRLALTGGVGIMVFTIVNAFLVGAVARGNWQLFEDEAAQWINEDPDVAQVSKGILSNNDLGDKAEGADEEGE